MNPAALPLEVFILVLVHLPVRDVWRLRSTAKSWAAILSSEIAVDQVLNGQDVAEIKRDHMSKPVSCIDLTTKHDWYLPTSYAFHGRHLAYMTYEQKDHGYDVWLYLQDIEGSLRSWQLKTRSIPRELTMQEHVAFIADQELVVVDLQGQMTRRKIPGTWRGGSTAVHGNRVAILRNVQERYPASIIAANTVYIYDHLSGGWSKKSIPETLLRSHWVQCMILDDAVLIISVGRELEKPVSEQGMYSYIMHVQTGEQQWTHRFEMRPAHDRPDVRGCEAHKRGNRCVVDVHAERARHSIELEKSETLSQGPLIPEYKIVYGGLETRAGFIWFESQAWRRGTARDVFQNDDYLVTISLEPYTWATQICAFRMRGQRQDMSAICSWAAAEEDKVKQLQARFEEVKTGPRPVVIFEPCHHKTGNETPYVRRRLIWHLDGRPARASSSKPDCFADGRLFDRWSSSGTLG